MTKWEYCQILYAHNPMAEGSKKVLIHLRTSGKQSEGREISDVGEALAELGLDGWELVSVTPTFANVGQLLVAIGETYYLKRQKR